MLKFTLLGKFIPFKFRDLDVFFNECASGMVSEDTEERLKFGDFRLIVISDSTFHLYTVDVIQLV